MRGLSRNKQICYYSLLGEAKPIYKRDKDGNIIYEILPNGEKVPLETGEKTNGYQEPVKFYGNIARGSGVAEAAPYGTDLSMYDAVLYAPKDLLQLEEMCLIWYQHEPVIKPNGGVDETSADYRVKRIPPCLDEVVYLLEGVV